MTADYAAQPYSSTYGVLEDALAGARVVYKIAVSQIMAASAHTTALTNLPVGAYQTVHAALMGADGALRTSSVAADWTWISGDAPEGAAWSVGSYGGEALVGLPDGREFPAGLDDLAVQGRPVGWQ